MRSSTLLASQGNLSKLQKHIDNTNREIIKCYQHHHSAILKTQALLGISNPSLNFQTPYKLLLSLNDQQLLYYSCKYFVIYNITNKEYQIINKDVKNCTLRKLRKFNTVDNDSKLIVGIYQSNQTQENTFIGLLTIRTDYESRTSGGEGRYEWKVVRLVTQQTVAIQSYTYFPKKNYLYIVVNKQSTDNKYVITTTHSLSNTHNYSPYYNNNQQQSKNIQQYLYIYDMNKEILLVNQQIKSNTVGFYVQFVSVEDVNAVYLAGRNYFRLWTVNFNQKSIKESNVRNIERLLKNKSIVDLQQIERYSMKLQTDHLQQIPFLNPHLQPTSSILTQPSKLLIILTRQQVLLIKSNQLICSFTPQQNISKQSKTKDNIQKQLQNSFNQIHKMKFLFDQYQQMKDKEDYYQAQYNKKSKSNNDRIKEKYQQFYFTAISKSWRTQNNNFYIAIANSKYVLLIYEIVDYQLKLYTEFDCSGVGSEELSLRKIVPVQRGDILLCTNEMSQVHLVNQQSTYQQNQPQIKSLWGNVHLHNGQIYAISSPMIQNIMCTVGQDNSFKLWSMKKNQRTVLFQSKTTGSKPLGITMHPGGTIVCVNFQRQIKLYTILPHQFYEITNIKTNYCPLQLRYSHKGQFLVSNQGSVLLFYESFSLKTLGYIEPADVQFKIVDFRLSRNASHICFVTEDNSCFVHQIDIGDLSEWEHFQLAHRQVEPYTAFEFDFIEKERISTALNEEKKVRSLFVGATMNKYMILYENLGSKLLVEFPVIDCYIVDIEICDKLMFAATSKGTIRVYNWPILQQELELEIMNVEGSQVRYKAPKYQEYQVWHESISIASIHKLNFTEQLIITNPYGNISIISYQQTKNKKIIYEQVQPQRKKMQQLINQMFYIKKSEIEKRNKLIEKTENDILKVENQILREKISLERKMKDEESAVKKGYEMKGEMQEGEKEQYIKKEEQEIMQLKRQIVEKKQQLQRLKENITRTNQDKKIYEQSRNDQVTEQIKQIVIKHKQKIKKKIESHKQEIRTKKKEYLSKVKSIQQQFNKQVVEVYEEKLKEINVNSNNHRNRDDKGDRQRNNGGDLMLNLLGDNVLLMNSSGVNYDTGNQSIKNLVDKLDSIQMQKNSILVNCFNTNNNNVNINNNPSIVVTMMTQPKSTQHIVINTQQNSVKTISTSQPQQQQPQTKLIKRSGMYQLSQKAFLRKKQKQHQQQRYKQLQQKILKSHLSMQQQFNNEILQEMTSKQNEDIVIQSGRVGQLQRYNMELEKQILLLKMRVTDMEKEDQMLQKQFQIHLQEYNLERFNNLNLHCEVLKMQNQLVQRKQVLDNKQQIVMLAFQQKQKLQNYKQLVRGSLTKMQQRKQALRQLFSKKQMDLNLIFGQLVNEIHKLQQKKDAIQKLQRKKKQKEKELTIKQGQLNEVVAKLKDVKKYLLLEKMNDQGNQKSIYMHEEGLVQTINFLKKRLFMESIKEKKNKQLKKSSLNQVLRQNKNLLEECNQLRSQGIQYQIQIKNLTNKLKDANKMIAIESKLNSQKHNVHSQKSQLEIMKKLFQIQMEEFDSGERSNKRDEDNINSDSDDHSDGQQLQRINNKISNKNVYFDAEERQSEYNKVRANANNLMGKSTPLKRGNYTTKEDYNQHKPFKLSKYIEAQPYQKI